MLGNESDRAEIDLMVRELTAKAPAPQPVDVRPGTRWSHVRIAMPSVRTRSWRERLSAQLALGLVRLPEFNRVFRMPGPVTLVRIWVALGALHCASMTFWPYPKTYLWGMVFYLLSLSLVLVTGVWGARLSWDARLGAAHTVALGTVLWAVTLATETLPPI